MGACDTFFVCFAEYVRPVGGLRMRTWKNFGFSEEEVFFFLFGMRG